MRPQEIVARALDRADGADLAVIVTETAQTNLRWAVNHLTTNGDTVEREVDVVAFDHRAGGGTATATVSGQVHDRHDLMALVDAAKGAARGAETAEDAAELISGGESAQWEDDADGPEPAAIRPVVAGLAHLFGRAATDGVEHFGYAERDVSVTWLGTTSGTRLRHRQVTGRAEFTAKSHGRARSAWHGAADVTFDAVDPAAIDDELRAGLAHQGRRLDIAPGRHTVLLSPSAVADLMVDLYWHADARSAVEGRSVFSGADGGNRVGEPLGSDITLASDPNCTDPSMRCLPFEIAATTGATTSPFDNGLALSRTEWIGSGVLRNLVSTRHSAALAGLPVTPGIDNLELSSGLGSGALADVVARVDDGLLVTCLWYNRVVDPESLLLTGLTRDGVYVVRNGEIVGACGNFRFNESPVSLLRRIVDAGDPTRTLAREMGDYFNRAAMSPLVVAEFNLSTASDAQ